MRKSLLLTTAATFVTLPLSVSAEEAWNIYGWQNHSYEVVEIQHPGLAEAGMPTAQAAGTQNFSRIQSNTAFIGFAASADTGWHGMSVNVQCENFVFLNQYSGGTGWCNRNSKFGLSGDHFGEISFAKWLLPFQVAVGTWVDPFYGVGSDSHANIMGGFGAKGLFYVGGSYEGSSTGGVVRSVPSEFNYSTDYGGGWNQGFNRWQENIIRYVSPRINGFEFQYAQTAQNRDDTQPFLGTRTSNSGTAISGGADDYDFGVRESWGTLDPVIRSASLAYEHGPFFAAFAWQKHEDWAAAALGYRTDTDDAASTNAAATGRRYIGSSDAEGLRYAARYIHDFGNGFGASFAFMYEDLEHEFYDTSSVRNALSAFGFNLASIPDSNEGINAYRPRVERSSTDFDEQMDGDEGDVSFERSAWMISSKVTTGGPWDFRFSYAQADDIDLTCEDTCLSTWDRTGATSYNIGAFYTMPAGTEFRITWSRLNNEAYGTYFQAVNGTAASLAELGRTGSDVKTLAVGLVHWFD